jgi:hypothetical protein
VTLVVLALLVAPAVGLAGDDGGPSTSFSHRMAQGRFLLDSGMFQQALEEFRAAAAMPQGVSDPEVHTLLARTSYRTGDVAGAVDAVRTARALSDSPTPDLLELHEFLTTRFGKVLVIGAGADDAHVPEPAVPILDPEIKRLFEAAVTRLGEPASSGSTSIYLPVGTYRVGGHLVDVQPEGTVRMDLRPTVGMATSGVYGERVGRTTRRDAPERVKPERVKPERVKPERTARKPRLPRPLDPPSSHLAVAAGGHGFGSQQSGSGGGRLMVGWEGHAGLPLGLRLAGGVAVHRLERISADSPAPAGIVPTFQLAAGPVLRAGKVLVAPWLAFHLGYGRPVEAGLPAGYAGPVNYLVFGPDLEVRLALPEIGPGPVAVRPQFAVRALIRESRPMGSGSERDPRPHLTVGAGFEVGLLVGRTR